MFKKLETVQIVKELNSALEKSDDFEKFFIEFMKIINNKDTTRTDLMHVYFDYDWSEVCVKFGFVFEDLMEIVETKIHCLKSFYGIIQ